MVSDLNALDWFGMQLLFSVCASTPVASCLSYVPEKGTVGASGDLAPLSHLALGLMGEGQMWSPKTGWGPAEEVLHKAGLDYFNKINV